jgi:hypothetical protein
LKLELFHLEAQAVDVGLHFLSRAGISLRSSEIKEFGRIAERPLEAIQAADHLLELGAFLAQLLRSIGGIPDSGLLELALYFLQPLMLVVVIKDTSSKRRCARRGL